MVKVRFGQQDCFSRTIEILTLLVAAGALGVSIVALAVADRSERIARAIAYAPSLKVEEFSFDDSVRLGGDVIFRRHADETVEMTGVKGGFYYVTVRVKNVGHGTANLRAYAWWSDSTRTDLLRQRIRNPTGGSPRMVTVPEQAEQSLFSGDTASRSYRTTVPEVTEEGHFLIHGILLYENPEGRLYDTYVWVDAEPRYGPEAVAVRSDTSGVTVFGPVTKFVSARYHSVAYDEEDAKSISPPL
jgi:hypothetical protein